MDTTNDTWFYAASNDRFPPDGQIVLGSIITNPRDPELSLNNPTDLLPIPPTLHFKTRDDLDPTTSSARSTSYNAGVKLKVPKFLDINLNLNHGRGSKSTIRIEAEKFVSRNFSPDRKYVAESVAREPVTEYIAGLWSKYLRREIDLYMITGLKIAYAATISRLTEETAVDKGAVELVTGVVGGPFGDFNKEKTQDQSFRPDGDFVVAVRLRRFTYEARKAVLGRGYFRGGAEMHGEGAKGEGEGGCEFEIMEEGDVVEGDFLGDVDVGSVVVGGGGEGGFKLAVWREE